jgi:3-methyladenine DNA glycosylase AlkD
VKQVRRAAGSSLKRRGRESRKALWVKIMPEIRQTDLAGQLAGELLAFKDEAQASQLRRFFKTGLGQYGQGDRFLGLRVPVLRSRIKQYRAKASLADCAALLDSEWHEIRMAALLLMVGLARRFAKQNDRQNLQELVDLYARRLDRINNWDLVDGSVRDIMGAYWKCTGADAEERRRLLTVWASSGHLWSERSAMVSVYALQRMGSLEETFWLAEYFIDHRHDLMHKAAGWMLREAGKIDREALRRFLAVFHKRLPRTALRYAIEHMPPQERQKWMAKQPALKNGKHGDVSSRS